MPDAAKAHRGGPRPNSGRKRLYASPVLRYTVRLPAEYVAALTAYGEGNMSAGVRRLVEEAGLLPPK